jgi:hypothetical protein
MGSLSKAVVPAAPAAFDVRQVALCCINARKRFLNPLLDLYQPQAASVNHYQHCEKAFSMDPLPLVGPECQKLAGKLGKTLEIAFPGRYML